MNLTKEEKLSLISQNFKLTWKRLSDGYLFRKNFNQIKLTDSELKTLGIGLIVKKIMSKLEN